MKKIAMIAVIGVFVSGLASAAESEVLQKYNANYLPKLKKCQLVTKVTYAEASQQRDPADKTGKKMAHFVELGHAEEGADTLMFKVSQPPTKADLEAMKGKKICLDD